MTNRSKLSVDQIRPFFQVVVFQRVGRLFVAKDLVERLIDSGKNIDDPDSNWDEQYTPTIVEAHKDTLVLFVEHRSVPTWLRKRASTLVNLENDIVITHKHEWFLYVHSNCHSLLDSTVRFLREKGYSTIDSRRLIGLLSQKTLEYRALGIQNIFSAGGMAPEAKSYYGRDTRYSLSPSYDGGFGFSYCLASERIEGRKPKPFGCSTKKNKIWQTWVSNVDAFKRECHELTRLLKARGKAGALSVLVRPLEHAPKTTIPVSFYMDFSVHKKGIVALSFDNREYDLNWDTYLSEKRPNEIIFASRSDKGAAKLIRASRNNDEWTFSYTDSGSIRLKFCESASDLESKRSKDLVDYLNENTNFTLLFGNGIGFRDGVYWQDNRFKVPFTKSVTFINWDKTDIRRESKASGPRTIAHAIEKHFSKANIGINDDRANEAADFIILDSGRFILIHSKFSSSSVKGLRVDDLQVVCSQALKNMRGFVPEVAENYLDEWHNRVFTTKSLNRDQFRKRILGSLRDPAVLKECWIVQPGISRAQLDGDPHNKIHILLNHLDSVCRSQNVAFQLVCDI